MRIHRFALAGVPLLAALVLAACGGSDAPAGKAPAEGGGAKQEEAKKGPPEKKMPEYVKSGVLDDIKEWQRLRDDAKHAKKDEREAKEKALADFLAAMPDKWAGKVPEPEGYYFGILLREAGKPKEAAEQCARYLDVAPQTHVNYANATTHRIRCLCEAGEFQAAKDALAKACQKDAVYATRLSDRIGAQTTMAIMMMDAGKFEDAVTQFEQLMTMGDGDPESAIYGADCLQRDGKPAEALAFAGKAADAFKEGKNAERMKVLAKAMGLVGQPAPGFDAAAHWKGSGGPVSLDGKVTLVFSWNMQARWVEPFFKRIAGLAKDYEDKDFQIVGISRLAKYDPTQAGTVKEMTDEKELEYYDMWANQYNVNYALAVGAYEDERLIDAWAANYAPSLVVVGKDGKVFYHRTGVKEEHFAALKEMIDKALAR